MIQTKVISGYGARSEINIAINEAYIQTIQDRTDKRDEFWKSKIEMANGDTHLCTETTTVLLGKIAEASK